VQPTGLPLEAAHCTQERRLRILEQREVVGSDLRTHHDTEYAIRIASA
jgi:hypothetical protein